MSPYCLTVLVLCQQIRAEANALLYGTNHFKFSIGCGVGPSPFNTIRALPQSGISQIKACTIRVFVLSGLEKSPIRSWMDEMCKLMKQGGNLQEIKVEVRLDHLNTANPSDLSKFERVLWVLKPLERLNGLKSVTVEGLVTEAYGAELKRLMEGDGTRKYKKRKAETDSIEEVAVRPNKKRRSEVGLLIRFNNHAPAHNSYLTKPELKHVSSIIPINGHFQRICKPIYCACACHQLGFLAWIWLRKTDEDKYPL